MLEIIAGRSGSGKSEYVHQRINNNADKGEIILLVPEQISFLNEKRILDDLGEKRAKNITVLSFRRLYNAVSELYGRNDTNRIDDGAKAVIMSLAAEEVCDKLTLYGSRVRKNDFAELMLTAVNEYKMCSISPEQLLAAASVSKDIRLKQKLVESAAVYSAYNAILENTYDDPDDDLTRLYEMLCEHPYFEGKTVYADSFNGFSGQEMKVLGCIIAQAKEVVITLGCDRSTAGKAENTIFREPDITMRQLKALAQRVGTGVKPVVWLDRQHRFRSESIAAVEESIFRFDGDPYYTEDGGVTLYEADDEYDEISQAARQITRLVMYEGYAYRDIAVICRRPEMFKNIILSEFPKYGIPYFLSDPERLEEKPLIRFVLSAFDIIHSSFGTEEIFTFLKTGMTMLSEDEVCLLENYAYMWDIRGKRWRSPFTMNPDGNSPEVNEAMLARLEDLRKAFIEPLSRFSAELSRAQNGGDMAKAVFMLLSRCGTDKKMKRFVNSLDVNALKQKENEARVWDLLMNLLDKAYTVLKNTHTDSRRFAELLRLMIKKNNISDIPRTLDQVIVGAAGNIKNQGFRGVFVIGALEGVFPAVPEASGLFTDSERVALTQMELPLYDSVYGASLKEKYNVYDALSMPSEKLFISRCISDSKGGRCEPSVIFKEVCAILGNPRILRHADLKPEDFFFTEEQCFEECAARFSENTPEAAALREYYSNSEKYSSRFNAVRRAVHEEPFRMSSENQVKKLFGGKMHISASQTEKYYLCPFAYFCRYGLKAKPREKAAMNAGMYGSAVHYILENLLKNEDMDSLKTMDDDALCEIVRKYTSAYIEELGGTEDRTQRFMAQFRSIEKNVTIMLRRLIEEFSVSSFVPSDFELGVGSDEALPSYELELPDGEKISVVGKIDRVDTYTRGGEKYIRIVDYKTNNKKFRLSDVIYGLNLQMLMYLSIIGKNGKKYYSEQEKYSLVPAGILYMPSTPTAKTQGFLSSDTIDSGLADRSTNFRMNGLLIDDKEILSAMEKDIRGIFIPAKMGSKGELEKRSSSVISLEQYGRLFSYIDKKLVNMAQSLLEGKIERKPVKGTKDACRYCDYKNACGFEKGRPENRTGTLSLSAAADIICADETDGKEEDRNE